MATISREGINRAILDALHECGAVAVCNPSTLTHPREYLVTREGLQRSLHVYCWNLTPGGRPSLPDEYRIQMTSVDPPLRMNPNGQTVLIGYDSERAVFAGFDIVRHRVFTKGSPSVHVSISTLNESLQNGLAFQTKSNNEIAVGIRSDLFLFYCERALELHDIGTDSSYLDIVERAVSEPDILSDEFLSLTQERQLIVQETARWSRNSTFTKQVLNAYDNRCSVTRHKLKLVDAAHILPVKAGHESIDNVRNGIALSPTYHRAFDNGLIFLNENMEMRLNDSAADELVRHGLDAGIDSFAARLGKIHLPYDPAQRPAPYFIRLANDFRGQR